MRVLGLDPSLTGFGWCVHDDAAQGPDRVVARGRFCSDAKSIFVHRYMGMRQAVADLLTRFPDVRRVGVESPPFGALFSEGLYGLFLYVNEALCQGERDVVFFDPSTVKMLTRGESGIRGKMTKVHMVAAARADTGIKSAFNHNEADAYHVARFSARFWSFVDQIVPYDDLSSAEKQAFGWARIIQHGPRQGVLIVGGAVYKENSRYFRFSQLPAYYDGQITRKETNKAQDTSKGKGKVGGGNRRSKPDT